MYGFWFLMRTPRKASLRSWPFWLLVAAWVCANGPQALTYDAISWVKGGQTFSHQERLVAEVNQAMSEKTLSVEIAVAPVQPEPREVPAMPAETVIKKLVLAAQSSSRANAPESSRKELLQIFDWSIPAAPLAATPYQPPRGRPLA